MRKLVQSALGAVVLVAALTTGCDNPGHAESEFYESSDLTGGRGAHARVGTMNNMKPQPNKNLGAAGYSGGGGAVAPGDIQNGAIRPLGQPQAPLQMMEPTAAAAPAQGTTATTTEAQGQGSMAPGFTGQQLRTQPEQPPKFAPSVKTNPAQKGK